MISLSLITHKVSTLTQTFKIQKLFKSESGPKTSTAHLESAENLHTEQVLSSTKQKLLKLKPYLSLELSECRSPRPPTPLRLVGVELNPGPQPPIRKGLAKAFRNEMSQLIGDSAAYLGQTLAKKQMKKKNKNKQKTKERKATFLTSKCSYRDWETDRKSTRLNSSHLKLSRMPSSA